MPKALRIHDYGAAEQARIDEVPRPEIGEGQVLIATGAAGINGLDWKVRQGFMRAAMPVTFPFTLGIEMAGTVVETGRGRFIRGDRVMGPMPGFGAFAEFIVVGEALLNLTPASLDDVHAAALPVAMLTAWQALNAYGAVAAGSRILVHGASGAIGGFVVQFAKRSGAEVIAVASSAHLRHVSEMGTDVTIDRNAERFEDQVSAVDIVVDLVGGDVPDRSWQVLRPHGAIVSTTTPDIAARAPAGLTGRFINMKPDRDRLAAFADKVSRGALISTISEVVDLDGLATALERNRTGHAPGKMVIDFHHR